MECRWGEVARNLAAMESFVREASERHVAMVVFPELTLTGIYKDNRVWELAEDLDGPSVRAACGIAERHRVIIGFGFTERARPLRHNAYCIAGPDGKVAGVYRKNCIPRLEVEWWQGHHERPVFEVGGKRFAIAICWDTAQERLLAEYGRERVEVVLMPHAWDADPLDSDGNELHHETMAELYEDQRTGRLAGWRDHDGMLRQFLSYIPARAMENRFHALFVNQCGHPHPALRFEGPTFAVEPGGSILASTRSSAEQMICVDIP